MSKTLAAINDLSGLGQSSLCAILPIISVMGIQACPLPTAVLSSQTDGYHDYAFQDLTALWPKYFAHWQKEAPTFDCIYSGFLGSVRQIDLIANFIENFARKHTLIAVDPVLGDGGELYDTMNEEMVVQMRRLITHADLITPNYTELCLLSRTSFQKAPALSLVEAQMRLLAEAGPINIVTTSIPTSQEDLMLTAVFERDNDKFTVLPHEMLPAHYPGSGDIFASVLIANLLNGVSLISSVQKAADFVYEAIRLSLAQKRPFREGVALEQVLPLLLK